MRTFGLIGYPLSSSFSQKYFNEKFARENISDCEFKNFPIENIEEFPSLIKNNPTLCGLSITIPHKQSVMKYLNVIDDETAKEIGAVNCIIRRQMAGYNTDVFGFEQSLKPLLKHHHNKALVLGTGGASKAIQYVLRKLKIDYLLVSRTKNEEQGTKILYSDLNKEIIFSHSLIINTTPLGMFPDINYCADIPYEFLSSKHLLYDLNYNPAETLFLKKGKERRTEIKNGMEMLHLQAEKAWEIWMSQ
ncbi:MAG: shikimate dehydrogenase [Bacteroidota bacterium]